MNGAAARSLPRVSIGMPVFNGELYVEKALRSLLSQTFADFELIVSDNASTDRTGEICRDYAGQDPRVRYYRNEVNVGFCRNQNRVYELSRGQYFLLAHHDDIRAPEYLERTVDVLDSDPSVIVCYTKTKDIDANGELLPRTDPILRLDSPRLRERFRDVIRMDHICEPDFGLMRIDALKKTRLHGDYADSDRVLLAELALYGRFRMLPECLFFRRAHPLQSTALAPDRRSRTVWFNPEKRGKLLFPYFRQFVEYQRAINRAPLSPADLIWCRLEMLRWLKTNRHRLLSDIEQSGRDLARPIRNALLPRGQV
ncbi:MAG TPA: glycosyltransferase family 2 protein [Candidatus Binatia bacterium]|jgi:glycosyltransferase involved in cell wall biosynthesis